MEKVLVTGGLGFIGSHIVDELVAAHYEVAIYDDLSTGKIANVPADCLLFTNKIEDEAALETAISLFRPDFIIHEAAQVSVANSVTNMTNDALVNIIGTIHVIKLAKKYGVKKIVFASSAAVYGESEIFPIPVTHDLLPTSPYGHSKKTAESYLQMAKSLYGIDYVILRYSNVYGPRQTANGEGGVVSIFMNKMIENKQITIFGDGLQTRDFVYVEDVATANVKALTFSGSGIFNISSLTSTSVIELFSLLQEMSASNVPPVYHETRTGEIRQSLLCNQLSTKKLGWQPAFSLADGLQLTYDFYVQALKNEPVGHAVRS